MNHWRREGLIEEPEEALVYFGGGGRYEIDDLRTRIVMLDMVKAEVNRMHQHCPSCCKKWWLCHLTEALDVRLPKYPRATLAT